MNGTDTPTLSSLTLILDYRRRRHRHDLLPFVAKFHFILYLSSLYAVASATSIQGLLLAADYLYFVISLCTLHHDDTSYALRLHYHSYKQLSGRPHHQSSLTHLPTRHDHFTIMEHDIFLHYLFLYGVSPAYDSLITFKAGAKNRHPRQR